MEFVELLLLISFSSVVLRRVSKGATVEEVSCMPKFIAGGLL